MYYKFSVILLYLTIYSQFTIVVYGEDELRTKKKKGPQQEQQKQPTVCILPIPLQSYQPSYVHSGVQFQHSYIGTNEELRKKGKPLPTDSSGCVVMTVAPPAQLHSNAENPPKKTKNKFKPIIRPIKFKRKKKKRKQQAQMLAMMEHDLGVAFKDLMLSLDYFWPKVQVTFTTGTASIGHNIFSGIIPLMAAGMKIKKILFLMMDPVMSSIWYSMGYSGHRIKPKTDHPVKADGENEETEADAQEEETHYSESAVVSGGSHYMDPTDDEDKEEEDDEEEEEEEEEDEEGEAQDDESEEQEEETSGEKEEAEEEDEEEETDAYPQYYYGTDQTVNGNIDYPSDPAKDSGEVGVKKKPKQKDEDFMDQLKHIWDGMIKGFDDLTTMNEYRMFQE